MLRAENARVARMLTADDRAAEAERKLRAAEARAEARAAEAERKLRALEARAAEERRQRAAEEEAVCLKKSIFGIFPSRSLVWCRRS